MQQLIEAAKIAAQSIWANKLRSFLTLLGVIIGVAGVIAVTTVITGARVYVDEKLASLGSGTFVLAKASVADITDFEKFLQAMRRNPDITMADVDALREKATYASYVGALDGTGGTVRYGNETAEGIGVQGATPEMIYLSKMEVVSGRYIDLVDEENRRAVAFIGHDVATALYPNMDPLGREIRIDGRPYTVVGVAKQIGTVLGQPQDNFVVIPLSNFRKSYGGRRSLSVTVRAREGVPLDRVEEQVRTIMRGRHQLSFNESDDFAIVTDAAIESLFGQIIGLVSAIFIPITLIALVVGGIVIMNIMLVVVTERTREIGIRKSLGARRKDIMMQFLVESTVLSGFGGALGILAGFGVAQVLSLVFPIPVAPPLAWAAIAVLLSLAVGLFFGIYPASRAAQLDPIQALRAE
jgi:putative ABC transport system permease protein